MPLSYNILMKKITTFLLLMACVMGSFAQNKEHSISDYFEIIRPNFTGETAYETTAFVEKYWRIAGNTGFNATVYRIAKHLEMSGYVLEDKASDSDRFTYRIEKRPLKNPTWEPVNASLTIVGEDQPILNYATNRNMIYLNSASTPPEGIEAEVIHIKDLKELESVDVNGKIIFAEMSPYRLYNLAFIENKAAGLITYNNPKYLQPEKNTTSIQFREIPYNEKGDAVGLALSYAAKERIKSALTKGKLSLKMAIKTKFYVSEELTIIADIIGNTRPKESLVFSAHIQEPGANDNATGVGTQLEMAMLSAKLIKSKQLEANRTLTFLWGDEIISTRRYIKEVKNRKPEINWGISLDMVGENTAVTGGSFLIEKMPDPSAIWTRGNDKHSDWGGDVLNVEDMKPHYFNDFIIDVFQRQGNHANWPVKTNPFEGGSDHTPFLKADIPGLLLWHFTDQFYHTDNDRIDKVSQETLKNVGTGAMVSAFALINADETTAKNLITLIGNTAKSRLQLETDLSKTALNNGAKIEDELKILKTWSNWYHMALESIKDIKSNQDTEVAKAISKAQNELKQYTDHLIASIK